MREAVDMMDFVNAAYVIGVAATLVMASWSWQAMRRAEKKREDARGK